MLSLEHISNKIKTLILYSLMEKNYSLGIFQLRNSIAFIANVSDEHKYKTISCAKFTHIFQKRFINLDK